MFFREAGKNTFSKALVTENVTLSDPGIWESQPSFIEHWERLSYVLDELIHKNDMFKMLGLLNKSKIPGHFMFTLANPHSVASVDYGS